MSASSYFCFCCWCRGGAAYRLSSDPTGVVQGGPWSFPRVMLSHLEKHTNGFGIRGSAHSFACISQTEKEAVYNGNSVTLSVSLCLPSGTQAWEVHFLPELQITFTTVARIFFECAEGPCESPTPLFTPDRSWSRSSEISCS